MRDWPQRAGDSASGGAKRRLRVGVIGLGSGRAHIDGWRAHPQVDVVALADVDGTTLAAAGAHYGIEALYPSGQAMLAHAALDAVSICTPNKFHMPLACAASAAGCHVLCEKPMARSAAEARAMVAAAEQHGTRLMIHYSYRFSAQARALKAQVDAGLFGPFYFGRTVWHRRRGLPGFGGWFGNRDLAGGGALIDLGVHRLDLALWLMDFPTPTWVLGSTHDPIATRMARAQGRAFDVEELGAALVRFDNGATLVLEASWAAHIAEAELIETRLLGTRAGLLQRNVGDGYTFSSTAFCERDGATQALVLDDNGDDNGDDGGDDGGVPGAMVELAAAILAGRPHPASGAEGLVAMAILDAIYASAASGAPSQVADCGVRATSGAPRV